MASHHDEDGTSRRGALDCMLWAGTGLQCSGAARVAARSWAAKSL